MAAEQLPTAGFQVRRYPLLPVALCLCGGMLLARLYHGSVAWPLGLAAAAVALFFILVIWGRGSRANLWRQLLLAGAVVLCGGAFWRLHAAYVSRWNIARFAGPQRQLCAVRLRVATQPEIQRGLHAGPLFSFAPPATSFLARVRQVRVRGGAWRAADGTLAVRVNGALRDVRHNQLVQVDGFIEKAPNPYLRGQRVFAVMQVPHAAEVRVLSARATLWPVGGWLSAYQAAMRKRFMRANGHGGVAAAMAAALLLGYRTPAVHRVARQFAACGAAHLLAISGLHVVIIAGAAWLLFRLFIVRPRRRAAAVLLVLGLYVLATPGGPAVMRAGFVAALALGAVFLAVPVNAVQLLSAAAVLVVLVAPQQLTSIAFGLTFAVTLAMVLLGRRLERGLFARHLHRQELITRAKGTLRARAAMAGRSWACAAISYNTAAALAAMPLVAYHYHQMNAWSMALPMLLLPLVLLLLLCGAAQLAAAWVWQAAARAVGVVMRPLAHATMALAGWCARIPGASIAVRPPPLWWVLLAYGVLAFWLARRRLRFSRATVAVLFAGAATLLAGAYAATQPRGSARLWVMPISSGNAAVVRSPDGAVLLLNAGSGGSATLLGHRVATFLRGKGVGSVDAAIATRVVADHASALLSLARRYRAGRVYIPLTAWANRRRTWSLRRFSGAARQQAVRVKPLCAGETLHVGPAMVVQVLWPPRNVAAGLSARRGVLVLRVATAGTAVLCMDKTAPLALALALRRNTTLRFHRAVLFGRGKIDPGALAALRQLGVRQVVLAGRPRHAPAANAAALRKAGMKVDVAMRRRIAWQLPAR